MNYYSRQTKDRKKEIKTDFKKDEKSLLYRKGLKYIIFSIIGIIIILLDAIYHYFYDNNVFNYILDGIIVLFLIFILICIIRIRKKELNNYALKNYKK